MKTVCCLFALASVSFAQEAKKAQAPADKAKSEKATEKPADKAKAEPELHTVKKEFLKASLKSNGVFEAREMTEIRIRPETWSDFTVENAVEHGGKVKKGDPLIVFDMKKIDEALEQSEAANKLTKVALEQAEEDMKSFEKSSPLDLEVVERTKRIADEEYKLYLDVDRAIAKKSSDFSLKNSKFNLDSAQEELKQLEKMYRAEDLREESEEIVLRRARESVDQAKFFMEMSQARYDEFQKLGLGRRDETAKEAAARADIAYRKAKAVAPLAAAQKRLAHEKAKYDQAKSEEKLAKLKKDRAAMNLLAPTDGVVYYGKCTRGNWGAATGGAPTDRYLKGQSLGGDQVWMTIVKPRPMFIRASLGEKEFKTLKLGAAGVANPTADPDLKLEAKIEEVASFPLGGNFDAKIAVTAGDDPSLAPGMTCSLKFDAFKREAVAAPSKMVFAEDRDEDERYVYVRAADGKPEKRPVKVGKTAGDLLEIVGGLQVGDRIYKEKPPETPAAGKGS